MHHVFPPLSDKLKPVSHSYDAKFQTHPRSFALSVQPVFTLCSVFTCKSEKRGRAEHYSSPFYTTVFSFTKNEKPLAVGSISTDLILPLS